MPPVSNVAQLPVLSSVFNTLLDPSLSSFAIWRWFTGWGLDTASKMFFKVSWLSASWAALCMRSRVRVKF
jgi:hypothetical protein